MGERTAHFGETGLGIRDESEGSRKRMAIDEGDSSSWSEAWTISVTTYETCETVCATLSPARRYYRRSVVSVTFCNLVRINAASSDVNVSSPVAARCACF
jgi:hypothetical protein